MGMPAADGSDSSPITTPTTASPTTDGSGSPYTNRWIFAFFETLWLLKEGVVLVYSMGFRFRWIEMSVRIILYGIVIAPAFLKNVWWYMNSPRILRRVPYRRAPSKRSRERGRASDSRDTSRDNNRAYVDIHFPLPVIDVLLGPNSLGPREDSDHDFNASGRDGSMTPPRSTRGGASAATPGGFPPTYRFPVIICVSGGAWIIGCHYWSSMLAWAMARCGYIVVTPDYRNFPQATMTHMVDDIEDAVAWTLENIHRFRGDPASVTLLGQSAGAHLSFAAVARQVGLQEQGVRPRFDPRRLVRLVGLSGIYNLLTLRDHADARGLSKEVLYKLCEGQHNIDRFSPHLALLSLSDASLQTFLPRRIDFVHGALDNSAPLSQSRDLAEVLRRKCGASVAVSFVSVPEATHTTPIVEDMLLRRSDIVRMYLAPPTAEVMRLRKRAVAHEDDVTTPSRVCDRRSTAACGGPDSPFALSTASFSSFVGAKIVGTSEEEWSSDSQQPLLSQWQLRLALWLCPF